MLLSIASTSNWFTEQQGELIEGWFEEVSGLAEERRMRHAVESEKRAMAEDCARERLHMEEAGLPTPHAAGRTTECIAFAHR